MSQTIDLNEVEKFSKIADEWWDESGKFKPLHQFNPIRLEFIRHQICQFFEFDEARTSSLKPFSGLKIIDIGCGGGLVSEPIARLGAEICGLDASAKNIEIAKIHAKKSELAIDYRVGCAENLAEELEAEDLAEFTKFAKFDVVLALEIIEHVADVEKFVESCAKLARPGGLVFIATLNRTLKSLATAKFGAEYILRWLPIGTHDWKKFLKPSEINQIAASNHLELKKLQGFSYCLFRQKWFTSDDLKINYCAVFKKINQTNQK